MSERIEELLARESAGTLDPGERAVLGRALEDDPRYCEVREGFRRIDAVVRSMPSPPSGWAGLWSRIEGELRKTRLLIMLLVGTAVANLVVAIAALVTWGDRFPLEMRLLLVVVVANLPVFLALAWFIGEQRRRLRDSTGNWVSLRQEWTARLDREIRALRHASRWFVVIAALAAIGAVIDLLTGDSALPLWLNVLGVIAFGLTAWLTRRDRRRRIAEREALRDQLGI